ncbi:lysozyme C-like [Notamacropus eugenii]|uniref:lysozyme C-like n=1 Tax=Notamacropus eugenii TaxID=9315 RepID=UPI003B67C213
MKVLFLLGVLFFPMTVYGVTMNRCAFARRIRDLVLNGYRRISLANWVCLARWESNFNTTATNYNAQDQSTDYGIFQINSRYWCDDDKTPHATNACGVRCSQLLEDNLVKAVECAKKILREQGIGAWVGWKIHCYRHCLSRYLEGCRL